MTWFARCDACGCRVPAKTDGGVPVLPPFWHEFPLDDDALHGCTREHLEIAKENERAQTPVDPIPLHLDRKTPNVVIVDDGAPKESGP